MWPVADENSLLKIMAPCLKKQKPENKTENKIENKTENTTSKNDVANFQQKREKLPSV